MFHKMLFAALLLAATSAFAQAPKESDVKKEEGPDYKKIGAPMPVLRLLKYHDSTMKPVAANEEAPKKKKKKHHKGPDYLTNDDLDNGSNLIVMMFNPTCSHCQDETRMMEKASEQFKNTKVVLIANPPMAQFLPSFFQSMKIAEYPMFYLGVDSSDFVNKVYLYSLLPQINIYDANRKLIKTFSGETRMDSLGLYVQ